MDTTLSNVLLLHEKEEDRWCLPKGHVDRGESLLGTALREIQEETGLVDLVRLADLGEITYRFYAPAETINILKVVTYFLFQSSSQSVVLEPIFDRAGWFPLLEASGRVLSSERLVIERARTVALTAQPSARVARP